MSYAINVASAISSSAQSIILVISARIIVVIAFAMRHVIDMELIKSNQERRKRPEGETSGITMR